MPIDPSEVVDTTEKKKPDPNFPGRSIIVTTVLHRDGTAEQWQRGEADPPTAGVKIGQYVDPDTRKTFEADRKAELAQERETRLQEKPGYHTLPDGSLAVEDPQAPGGLRVVATKPQGPQVATAPTLHQMPDGSQVQFNPATGKWEPFAAAKPAPGTAPALNLPAARPGQRTDLSLVEQQANQFIAGVNADPSLTPTQRTAKISAYIETVVKPAAAAATQEANDYAADQQRRQAEADARAARSETRQLSTEERLARTGEETSALARAKFGYEGGQDAVSNAMKLLPYQANPLFAEQFASALNTVSSGGGPVNFTAEAFRVPLPDLNALAEQGAQRAAAMYAQTAGTPFTPRPGPGALPPPATVPPALATSPMAPPPPRTSMPGAATAPPPISWPVNQPATPGVPAGTPSPLPPGWEQQYPQPPFV